MRRLRLFSALLCTALWSAVGAPPGVAGPLGNPPPDLAPDSASLASVLALVRGSGPAPSYREHWNLTIADATLSVTVQRAGSDWRIDTRMGPLSRSNGLYQTQHWHRTWNGQTVLDSGLVQSDRIDEAVLLGSIDRTSDDGIRLIGARRGDGAHVLEVDAPGAGPTWVFVDPKTGDVVRSEFTIEGVRVTVDDSDFRVEGSRRFAHTRKVTDETGNVVGTFTLASDEEAPADLDLAVASSTRDLITFPEGQTVVQIPATFAQGHVIVRVTIGGRGLDFVLDSGASTIFFDEKIANQLQLPTYGPKDQGAIDVAQSVVKEMSIGPFTMHDVAVGRGKFNVNFTSDLDVVGLVGFDFISGAVIHIDYEHRKVEAIRSDTFAPETIPHAFGIPIALDDGVPLAPVLVGNTLSRNFIIDTGSDGSFIFSGFAAAHPDDVKDQGRGDPLDARFPFLFGHVGGFSRMHPVELRAMRLGPTTFTDYLIFRTEPSGFEHDGVDGIIGSPMLSLYDVYLDYASGRVVIVPSERYRKLVR